MSEETVKTKLATDVAKSTFDIFKNSSMQSAKTSAKSESISDTSKNSSMQSAKTSEISKPVLNTSEKKLDTSKSIPVKSESISDKFKFIPNKSEESLDKSKEPITESKETPDISEKSLLSKTSIASKNKPLAVITGGTSGIGAAYAMAFAKQKYNLLLIALSLPEETNFLIDQLEKKYGVRVKVLKADLSVQKDVSHIVSFLKKEPRIDVLINCAGFGLGKTFEDAQLAKEEAMIRLHCMTPIELTRAVLPIMHSQHKGQIINVSSFGGLLPMKKNVVYGSTKAFLKFFSESLSLELFRSGITVHALVPGFVKTHFHDNISVTKDKNKKHWLLPWQTPDEVVIRSLHSFRKGNIICIPHWKYRCIKKLYSLMPKKWYQKIVQNI